MAELIDEKFLGDTKQRRSRWGIAVPPYIYTRLESDRLTHYLQWQYRSH